MKIITTKKAPTAIGPYSQAIIIDNTLYSSGQIPINPISNLIETDFEKQVLQVFSNINGILESAKYNINDIVKVNVYLKNLNDFNLFNTLYANFFQNHKPVRTTIEVSKLPKDALIEIDFIANKKTTI